MSKAQKAATANYRAKQLQIQALINPATEPALAADWEYLRRQFSGSGKKALAWAISRSRDSMDTFRVWKDGAEKDGLRIRAVNMNSALDEAAFQFGFVDYADMAQSLGWAEGGGLNITNVTPTIE